MRGRLETVRCLRLEARTLWSAVGDHPADRHNRRLESGQSTHDQELSVPGLHTFVRVSVEWSVALVH